MCARFSPRQMPSSSHIMTVLGAQEDDDGIHEEKFDRGDPASAKPLPGAIERDDGGSPGRALQEGECIVFGNKSS
jgi:hypothetical protein